MMSKSTNDFVIKYRTQPFNHVPKIKYSDLVNEYQLDDKTNQLVVSGQISTSKVVNSYKSSSLDNILNKFLPDYFKPDDNIYDVNGSKPKLEMMMEMEEQADSIKEKYNLNQDLSISETFAQLQKMYIEQTKKTNELLEKVVQQNNSNNNITNEEENNNA